MPVNSVRLFRTASHPCSYKPNHRAATVFVDPNLIIDQPLNSKLSDLGYRRSGKHLYRPDCDLCKACISCRLPVDKFQTKRRHRKILKKNMDLKVIEENSLTSNASYDLYERYINSRHRDGDMYPASMEQFESFIKMKTLDTRFFLFYLQEELVAVSVTDMLQQGLSAVYTYFDPDLTDRSLGNYVILWQIEKTRSTGLPYLYLGYWIKNCPKMQYKSTFRPLELLVDKHWILAH